MVPPGLAFLSVSEKAWARMNKSDVAAFLFQPERREKTRRQRRIGLECIDRVDARPP
jgi:aspartate aminotransferase-like enzyme